MIAFARMAATAGLLVALGSSFLGAQPTRTRLEPSPAVRPIFDDDSHTIFQSLFHYRKIEPITNLDEITEETARKTIVVLIHPEFTTEAQQQTVRKVLAGGGAVYIAGEVTYLISRLLPGTGGQASIVGGTVLDEDAGTNSWLEDPKHPFASPVTSVVGRKEDEQALDWFKGLKRVACNYPSAIRVQRWPEFLQLAVAEFPRKSRLTFRQAQIPLPGNHVLAVAGVGSEKNPYRCAVIADPNLLTNTMLLTSIGPEDRKTDNFLFAYQTVLWLQGPSDRNRCLFIHNGSVVKTFDHVDWAQAQQPPTPPLPPIPPGIPRINIFDRPLQEKMADVADRGIQSVEDRHLPDQALVGGPKNDRQFYAFLRVAALLGGLFLVWLMVRRAWRARQKPEFQPMPKDPLHLGEEVVIASFEHRRLELMRGGDLLGPVREYIRMLFHARGWPADLSTPARPHFEITARNPKELKLMLQQLWGIAYGNALRSLPYSRWKELEPVLTAVQSAADADRWRVSPASKGARS